MNYALIPFCLRMAFMLAVVGYCDHAGAYENEHGVPLTVSAELGKVGIERVAIRLEGREVEISTDLNNETAVRQNVAFYAATPLFSQLGVGEEHADKSFADLRVLVGKQPRKVSTSRRAYFLGRDITDALVKAGLSVLPDTSADAKKLARLPSFQGVKPELWQATVVQSWTDSMPPKTSAIHRVRYRALPRFSLDELASDSVAQSVRQHCGEPDVVRQGIALEAKDASQVLVERYEIPVPFMTNHEVTVEVEQPKRNWLGAHPVVALVCGTPGRGTKLFGQVDSPGQTLNVLVISTLDSEAANGKQ